MMKDTIAVPVCFFTILFFYIIDESYSAPSPSPVPESSFVFPGPSTSDNYNPSSRSFVDDYNPSSSEDNFEGRHLYGYKRKHRKPYLTTGHGCRGYRCGYEGYEGYGLSPSYIDYYSQNQPSGNSYATASAGTNSQPNHLVGSGNSHSSSSSSGGGGGGGAITSQANAQSATFNFGPFSASFSTALAISAPNRYNIPTNYNY